MIDECYSFESVGGPFSHMLPSQVLENEDETAFRCGKNDWEDSQREEWEEYEGEYYDKRAFDNLREEIEAEVDAEIEEEEREAEEAEAEEEADTKETP